MRFMARCMRLFTGIIRYFLRLTAARARQVHGGERDMIVGSWTNLTLDLNLNTIIVSHWQLTVEADHCHPRQFLLRSSFFVELSSAGLQTRLG